MSASTRRDLRAGWFLLTAIFAITLAACAASHPEQTWPPRLEFSCEHPEVIGETAAVYASLSNSRGGPYIVNSPYATDGTGARTASWGVATAARRAGGRDKLLNGLSELPSEAAASTAVTADATAIAGGSLGVLAPAVPFMVYHEAPGGFANLRVELGTFCHSYLHDGGKLGCPRRAESDESVKGYVFIPAGRYDQLHVEVDDPNSITRRVNATCSIN
ncbi:MAG: hypothetical protein ACREQC_11675 [Candidatus Binataceae bacterium]